MTAEKIIGIANRLATAPKHLRAGVRAELDAAIDEVKSIAVLKASMQLTQPFEVTGKLCNAIATLRDALTWDEVKANPPALARIARTLRTLRESK